MGEPIGPLGDMGELADVCEELLLDVSITRKKELRSDKCTLHGMIIIEGIERGGHGI